MRIDQFAYPINRWVRVGNERVRERERQRKVARSRGPLATQARTIKKRDDKTERKTKERAQHDNSK